MRMKRNFKAIPVLFAGLFTSQVSIAAGSVSADPHAGHDMSAMQMSADENFTEMTSMEPVVTESRTPIPPVTNADRKAAFGNLQGHAIHDSAINYLVLLDQLEWQRSDNSNNFSWSVNSWIGGDTDRLWLKSEGERSGEKQRRQKPSYSGDMRLAHGGIWLRVSGRNSDLSQPRPGLLSVFRDLRSIILSLKLRVLSVMVEKPLCVWEENTTFYLLTGSYSSHPMR